MWRKMWIVQKERSSCQVSKCALFVLKAANQFWDDSFESLHSKTGFLLMAHAGYVRTGHTMINSYCITTLNWTPCIHINWHKSCTYSSWRGSKRVKRKALCLKTNQPGQMTDTHTGALLDTMSSHTTALQLPLVLWHLSVHGICLSEPN